MEQFTAFWQGQDKRRLAILALATIVAFVSVLYLTRLATAPRMELLYARLEPSAAAEVVANLESRGVAHEVRGDAVYVDGAQRDALRLQLAGEGLPRGDGTGYELLDGLSGFGTTSQMFDAAYWRAREGELTRTILAGPGVRQARVHLATADSSPFSRDRSASASVTMQMVSGAVTPSLARAVQSLVAGAVRNLAPADVTVIDAASGRVMAGAEINTEGEQRDARLQEMRQAVENLLDARVGPGRHVVELSLETTRDREVITERVLDPESRVIISVDTEERNSSDSGSANGAVTVASNLPDGDAAGDGGQSQSSDAETRERVNYDFSATQRQIERDPGAIERVTVAVLVDGVRGVADSGDATWAPRTDTELETLRELVQSAVGFRDARGDVITVRSMEFEKLPDAAVEAGLSLPWISSAQVIQLVTALLTGLVGLGLLAFVVRPLLAKALAVPAVPATAGALAAPGVPAAMGLPAPDGMSTDLPDLGNLPDLSNLSDLPALPGASAMDGGPPALAPPADDPVDRLKELISERRDETIEVLRGWMDETKEDAS